MNRYDVHGIGLGVYGGYVLTFPIDPPGVSSNSISHSHISSNHRRNGMKEGREEGVKEGKDVHNKIWPDHKGSNYISLVHFSFLDPFRSLE